MKETLIPGVYREICVHADASTTVRNSTICEDFAASVTCAPRSESAGRSCVDSG